MKKIYSVLACLLQLFLQGCLEYIKIEDESKVSEAFSFPPMIDINGLNPSPEQIKDAISVGKDCKGQAFIVPYIADRNTSDKLYYLWFFDKQLAWPQYVIEPEARELHIPTITIDEQFLLSLFENKMPADFFSKPHLLEFFVSDKPYHVPASKYHLPTSEKNHGDYAYWIITFTKDPCSF